MARPSSRTKQNQIEAHPSSCRRRRKEVKDNVFADKFFAALLLRCSPSFLSQVPHSARKTVDHAVLLLSRQHAYVVPPSTCRTVIRGISHSICGDVLHRSQRYGDLRVVISTSYWDPLLPAESVWAICRRMARYEVGIIRIVRLSCLSWVALVASTGAKSRVFYGARC